MSAWQCSSEHIARMIGIAGALDFGDYQPGRSDANRRIFDALAMSNAINLVHLYGGTVEPVPYKLPPTVSLDTVPEIVAAIKVFDCYVYQSSDFPGWDDSRVAGWCRNVKDQLIRSLPGFRAAYDAAPWGVTA